MIEFPERIGTATGVKLSSFEGTNGTVNAVEFEMDNGDVFSHYSSTKLDFIVGDSVKYTLVKDNGKTKVKNLKSMRVVNKPLISNLDNVSLEEILFIDIETVRVTDKLGKGSLRDSWEYKMRNESVSNLDETYEDKAPLYAEFAKVVCVTIGMVKSDGVYIQSYYGDLEKDVLAEVSSALNALFKKYPNLVICGHSILGFDIPFLIRRFIVNQIRVPKSINVIGEKPWNLSDRFLDIAEWWKSTGFYGASLCNITTALDIESPKQEIDGSKVSNTYYKIKGGLTKIVKYCEEDVFACIKITQHLFNIKKSVTFVSKTFSNESK